MPLVISARIRRKLTERHGVSEDEVRQCFLNQEGNYLPDIREEHATEPPTFWFIAETNQRRKLKVVFVARQIETPGGGSTVNVEIKTAYEPDTNEIEIYERRGKC